MAIGPAVGPMDFGAGRINKADFTNVVKTDNKSATEKQANVSGKDIANLDFTNKVEIKFNGKAPSTEVKTVSFFNDSDASVGKTTMKSAAEQVGDIDAGAKQVEANKIYNMAMSLFI